MRMIIMGPPGVGKGTASLFIAKKFNIPHISTGDIFRSLYKSQTEIGKIAKHYLDRGELVPDDVTNSIVYDRLMEEDTKNGFLLDGFPRNLVQAMALDSYLEEKNSAIDVVLDLVAEEELIVRRISGRRICPKCGSIYHIEMLKPKEQDICDKDGTKLIQRQDDSEETIRRRLEIHYALTKPVIDYYKQKKLVISIDGSKSVQETQELIMKALGEMI